MKVTSISYQKTFNLGNYCSERIGVEIDIEEGDSLEEGFKKAREMTEKEHRENNPQLYPIQVSPEELKRAMDSVPARYATQEPPPVIQLEKQKTTEEKILEGIQSSSEIKILETYKLLSKNNPKLKEAYDKRLGELSK